MRKHRTGIALKRVVWFVLMGLCLSNFGGASIWAPALAPYRQTYALDPSSTHTLRQLKHFGLLGHLSQDLIEELLAYQRSSGKSLGQILSNPWWRRRLGLSATTFQATWYMSNPFEVLPRSLQNAIRKESNPFKNRRHLMRWLDEKKASPEWRQAIDKALIETTAENLWRASKGLRPYAFNGEFLEPIIVERGYGVMDVRDGHIATDPRFIPTNSEVLLLVTINGEERILKVKATDTGSAIKGRHVDLPIYLDPRLAQPLPHTRFPAEFIRNPYIKILTRLPASNRGRRA